MDDSLSLLTQHIDGNNISRAIDCICNISTGDNDFIGENGADYLWEEAEEQGFENNYDYVCTSLKEMFAYKDVVNEETLREICDKFLSMWLDNDVYYSEYNYVIIPTGGDSYTMVLAYVYGY